VDERRCTNADIICNFFSLSAAAVSTVRGGEIIRVKMSRQVPCRFPNRKFRVNPTANDDDDGEPSPPFPPSYTKLSKDDAQLSTTKRTCTPHDRTAPPRLLVIISRNQRRSRRSLQKSTRCIQRSFCHRAARRYVRAQRTRSSRRASLRTSRLYVASPRLLLL
jgi:hypothetical protein